MVHEIDEYIGDLDVHITDGAQKPTIIDLNGYEPIPSQSENPHLACR